MTLVEILTELKEKDIHVYLQDGDLTCKAPTGALTADLKTTLQSWRKELAEHLQYIRASEIPPLLPVSRLGKLPLSFAQQRLWVLSRMDPDSAFYNVPAALRIKGTLDISALEETVNAIIGRHEVLRTTFATREGQPLQVIRPELRLDVPVEDLSDLPAAEREAEEGRRVLAEARRPFDLERGPLLRTWLLYRGEGEEGKDHVLLFTLHHIVSDGWSTGIFIREFVALYHVYAVGGSAPLPELPIQYADYAVWQRQWLQGELRETQAAYWKTQLLGAPEVLELPTAYPRPPMRSHRGATYSVVVSPALTGQLNALSRRQNVSLFMTLLAVFQVLLSRYSGQTDICVGTPAANRSWIEIEGLIGFFVNTLVLRTDLSGNPTFLELLRRVRDVCLDAQMHQDLPFEMLVEDLYRMREWSGSPLFQVMFVLQSSPTERIELRGLEISPMVVETQTAKFDLTLIVEEGKDGLTAVFEYSTDLFDEPMVARTAKHYVLLLESIAEMPETRLLELPLLTESERWELLLEWNKTVNHPQHQTLSQVFDAQSARTPERVAAVYEGQSLTYAELNARSSRSAHYLCARGVGPDVLVGLCVERSLEMIVGILGILKAGGVYVPLDPAYPEERLAWLLEDTGVAVLLSLERCLGQLPESEAEVVCLDRDWPAIADFPASNPPFPGHPANLAYVIYTSGSTGKPKGVLISHGNVLRLFEATRSLFGFGEQDVWTLFHAYTFDLGVALILSPQWTVRLGNSTTFSGISTVRL